MAQCPQRCPFAPTIWYVKECGDVLPNIYLYTPVKPLHIAIALLCENIKTFEDAQIYIKKPPILDIPLLWNVIQRVGGDPASLNQCIYRRNFLNTHNQVVGWSRSDWKRPIAALCDCRTEIWRLLYPSQPALVRITIISIHEFHCRTSVPIVVQKLWQYLTQLSI